VSALKLFHTVGGVTEVVPRLAVVEADLQDLIEAHMEAMLGVRFLAREYSTGPVHAGRIDSLGLDENGAPVIVEYKRGTDAGILSQGLYYLAWLTDHKAEFQHLVRDRLGPDTAAQVLWSAPRLICVAGDFSRYDIHAVREHRRSIDLVRYRFFGSDHIALETVASATGRPPAQKEERHRTRAAPRPARSMQHLAAAVDEALLGLGDDITLVHRKQYRAYRRLRNFACVCPPQQTKILVYLSVNPKDIDLQPDFTRAMTALGHHGTGDLEVQLRTERDLERALDLFRLGYAKA
jgi:predicted transport protein